MEVGRRFGNQVGDPIRFRAPDIRGDATAAGFFCDRLQPTTAAWQGYVLAHLSGRRAGSFASDPFFLSAPPSTRVWLEFFLAGPLNSGEDVTRYLRTGPADRVAVGFTRRTMDQVAFRVYRTAGLTANPDVLLTELAIEDRVAGTPTAAEFRYVTDALRRGSHSFRIAPLDSAGNERTGCSRATASVTPWPLPPTGVEVHAYSASIGRVTLKWSQPSDIVTGDKFLVYRASSTGQPVSYAAPVKSAVVPFPVTGSPSKAYATFSLGATGAAAQGPWIAGVRHRRSAGTIEDNVSALCRFVIGTDGAYVGAGRPLAPTFVTVDQKPGGRLVVAWKHDDMGEPNPTKRFKVYRGPGVVGMYDPLFFDPDFFGSIGPVNYATAIATRARTPGRFFLGTAGFVLSDGYVYRFGVRSEATAGVREFNTAYAMGRADATPPTSCANSVTVERVVG